MVTILFYYIACKITITVKFINIPSVRIYILYRIPRAIRIRRYIRILVG